ncbi:hypothetical protein B0H12DRAFT_275761 [Mycena haematopus]|nr:hypothetical protein B0H12DRAFT_275761 [Mycena haematopus]
MEFRLGPQPTSKSYLEESAVHSTSCSLHGLQSHQEENAVRNPPRCPGQSPGPSGPARYSSAAFPEIAVPPAFVCWDSTITILNWLICALHPGLQASFSD